MPTAKRLLETSTILIGYAMSRLDQVYLRAGGYRSWKDAFARGGKTLGVAPASLKNLRDEFDPVHGNARRGWHGRPLRASRQRVLGELCGVSDSALLEFVRRILANDFEAVEGSVAILAERTTTVSNVAERLLTGRRAEDHFLENCRDIIGFGRSMVEDYRLAACGFDFGVRGTERLAVEVKGLKEKRGDILFTDREWVEAQTRKQDYWLVIVGNLQATPLVRLITDPAAVIDASCRLQTSVAATWRASVTVG